MAPSKAPQRISARRSTCTSAHRSTCTSTRRSTCTSARRSTRTSKPTHKQAQSESQSSLQRSKIAQRATQAPYRRRLPPVLPQSNITDHEDEDEGQFGQPIEVLDNEDEDLPSSVLDDDDAEVAQLEEQQQQQQAEEDVMKYPSVWKAVVNGKENLASWSAIFADEELYMFMVRQWRDKVIEKAQPQQLEVVKLKAVASFERGGAVDECPFNLQDQQDIERVYEVLRM
jgi:hypothetical protein